jgi:tetratricopeptide (TPR) repeat protein
VQAKLIDLLTNARAAIQSKNFEEAEKLIQKALDLDSKSPDGHMAMAILMATTGRLAEAIHHFRIVLKEHPQLAQVRANLATALYESEQFEESIVEFEKALKIEPSLIKAKLTYASALRKSGQDEKALAVYQEILSRYPQSHEALNGIGLTYMNLEKEDESLNAFHFATQLAPNVPEYRLNFAIALDGFNYPEYARLQYEETLKLNPGWLEAKKYLLDNLFKSKEFDLIDQILSETIKVYPEDSELIVVLGRLHSTRSEMEEAITCYERALSIDPDNGEALLGRARIFAEEGDFGAAIKIYENMIKVYPKYPRTYLPYSTCKKFKSSDPLIALIEKNISEAEGLLSHSEVNFALGKIYNDCEDWEKAFAFYQRGNDQVNRYKRYKPENDEEAFDQLMNNFSPKVIDQLQSFQVGQTLPILIVGMPRSGTTLVESIIARHSKVRAAGEVEYWSKSSKEILTNGAEKITLDKAKNLADGYIARLKAYIKEDQCFDFITDKMPHNFLRLGLIGGLFPKVPIIHCKRDPMDNCLSIYFQSFEGEHLYAYDLKNLGFHYQQYQRLMAYWHEVFPGRILDVQYEHVVADPEYWAHKIIEHVGLEWEDSCLEQNEVTHRVKTASIWQARQPIYKTSVKRWKNYEKHLGPLKEALGYKD